MLKDFAVRTSLPASDLERAKKFYEETLGFTPVNESPAGVDYESGGVQFFVFPSRGESPGSFTQMGWRVDDIDAEVKELKERGVQFEEYDFPGMKTEGSIADIGAGRSAWFKDTEGNLLGLIQYR